MAHDSGIDPRYAAQFQRGFDPAQHEAPPAPRGPVRLEGGPPPTAPRVPDPPRMIPAPTPESEAEASDSVIPTPPSDEATSPATSTWWDWLLPVIGAVLIVIAFMLWWGIATDTGNYYGPGTNDDWSVFVGQARYMLPGPLMTAGIIAITGGIVLQAVRPRR